MVNPPPGAPRESADFRKLRSRKNLELAWQRLQRAREPAYKWYWRHGLIVAVHAKEKLFKRLANELKDSRYDPDSVCLFSEPKKTRLLRHKSILSIGDHLVYQAVLNIVADKLHKKTKNRYGRNIFGNLYSGPGQPFFLQRWEEGYQGFNNANRRAYYAGKTWLVEFDFASFYDSISHTVLRDLLRKLNIGTDLCDLLCGHLLPRWSSHSDESRHLPRITRTVGIPQGPLPSPLLAEVVLAYIDDQMVRNTRITYLRYADDIRIWGESERDVQFAAAILDRLARNIGIFPQSKKFSVGEVTDVEAIVKSISASIDLTEPDEREFNQIEESFRNSRESRVLWRILREFERFGVIEDETRFKFYLAGSPASNDISNRIVQVIRAWPHLAEPCCAYIHRLERPSGALITDLIALTREYPGYPWLAGRVLREILASCSYLVARHRRELRLVLIEIQKQRGIRTDCQLQGIVFVLLSEVSSLSSDKLLTWLKSKNTSWWARVYVILNIREARIRKPLFVSILQELLESNEREVSRAAAHRLSMLGSGAGGRALDASGECDAIFQAFGVTNDSSAAPTRCSHLYVNILKWFGIVVAAEYRIGWQGLLGDEYLGFDGYAVKLLGEAGGNGDLFIQLMQAAWEPVLEAVWLALGCSNTNHDGGKLAQGKSKCGVRRSEMFRKKSDLVLRMPQFCSFIRHLDDARHHGHASHRKNDHTGLRGRPISFADVRAVLRKLPGALDELQAQFPS